MYRTEPPIATSARALRKRLSAAALAMLGTCTALTVAEAQAIHATPDDNVAIGITQASLASTHAALVVLGLAPGPLGTPAEVGALSADLALKSTPAILEIPADLALFPNAPLPGSSIPFSCVYRFAEPVLAGDSAGALESEYEAIFFIPYNPLDDVFGDLGTPTVYHPQADIAVDVSNPYLNIGEPSGRLLLPEFPEGRHSLEWRAGTSFNYVLDAALPSVLIATFAYAEGRVAAKAVAQATKKAASQAGKKAAREAAKKQADYLFTLVRLAEEAGLITAEITSAGEATDWYEATTVQTAVNEATQTLTVWDTHVPYVEDTRNGETHILAQDIVLEATDFGGARFGRVENELRSMFELVDDCGKLFETTTDSPDSRLLAISDTPEEIEWTARELENGPYRAGAALAPNQALDGEEITTVLVQRVLVRDTQAPILVPPPGFARYSSTPVDLTGEAFPLGLPKVVDLADPAPSVTNDAPDTLEVDRRYVVNWQATDAAGNVTQPGAGMPEQYAQVVTIKSPGTNTAPAAQAKSAATLTSRPVEIELTGTDTDLLDGRVDPLAFEIEDYPVEGIFEAPLYPFFIEDFRLSPVGDQDTPDGLTRTSPLGELADAFRLLSPIQHAAFLIDEICNQPAREPFNGTIPVDFIYQPTYVHVDDEGFYYVRDGFWVCGEPQAAYGSGLEPMHAIPRLSKWNEAGELVAMRPLYPTVSPLYDDTNLGRNMRPGDEFSVDGEGRLWIQLSAIQTFFSQYVENYSLSADLGDMRAHGAAGYSEQDLIAGRRVLGIAGDLQLGVIYELHQTGCPVFGCSPDVVHRPIVVRDGTGAVDLTVEEGIVGRIPLPPGHSFGGTDIRSDSEGNVYVVDMEGNRIHKFSRTYRDERGEWVLGEYVGWLGSCTANLENEAGVPYSGCDEARGISKGYACTDFTCARAADTSGSAPGQFDAPGSIVIDPRDVLYVGDLGNSRVQRFAPDGTFAGAAESTGTGVNTGEEPGFILGGFGRPEKLAVNSSSLYVFDGNADVGDYFLHVFKTLPFYDVTDASARVKYVSDFDFQGRDRFTYVVDDGIDESEPAPVDVTVTRAFRPPERLEAACFADESLEEQVPCTLAEDTSLVVRLRAYDPDGFMSTGGLDRLTFEIDEPAANGTLEPLSTEDNSATYRYTPRADYYGEDAFAFNAGDGVDTTTGGKALLTVTPVPDIATIDFGGSPIIAGRGFRRVVMPTYRDADGDAASNPTLLEIDWGDGLTASAPSWQRSGRLDPNGREINPQEALDVAGGMLAASHVYLDTGDYGLSVTMANYDGDTVLQDSFNETAVSVIEATKVSAVLALPVDPLAPDTAVAARIDVTNHVPEGWDGLVAGHVEISVTVPQGLTFTPLDGRCTAGEPIVCSLGDLAQGETIELPFEASIALADARVESDYVLDFELADDGPNFIETNVTSAVIGISDRDGDGTIDVDDAFADDDRYVADTDGDGLADAWELAFGYDPGVADDTSADADGDGVTLAGEFAGGSYPWLADEHGFAAGNRLETGQDDDLFGIAIAGGDFNGDGYADTVIGAPYPEGGAGAGAVYIANGSADGASLGFPALAAQSGQTAFGRDLAVGDFDGNGRPDLAIASANAVSIYFNNGRILAVPDLVLEGEAGRNFGIHLTAGDLDGDGADDLVVGEQTHDPVSGEWSGSVSIYASARGGVAGNALTVTDPSILLGRGSAIGDIDGDGRSDLLLNNSAPEEVLGYLGADNDWSATDAPVVSFRLSADEPFGYGLLFGYVMASGADIGGDGIDDLVVTGWGGNPSFVHVFDSTTAYWDVATTGARSAVAPWITIDTGVTTHPEHLGFSVALAELDADGHADLVAGAIYGGGDPLDRLGEVRVFRGGDAGSGAAALGAPEVFGGSTPNGVLGYEVAVPGDVDGDGYADVVGGAPGEGTADVLVGYVQIWRHVFAPLDPLEDPDVDGVGEAFDNCPVAPNTDQANVDGDAAGDVCDPDADGDGFSNADDNCPLVASIDQGNTDGDGAGDACDTDDDNDAVDDIDDPFPLDVRYAADSDADGLPDEWEQDFGLDPNDAIDAGGDLDGDGRSNRNEFAGGFDPTVDDAAPVLETLVDFTIDATGPFTPLALQPVSAIDGKDGDLPATPDRTGPFRPGVNIVTWTASDAAGNTVSAEQAIRVRPLVGFGRRRLFAAEGTDVTVDLVLNGDAIDYPVTVTVASSGSATEGSDYTLASTGVDIDGANAAALHFSVLDDGPGEPAETVTLTIASADNAVIEPVAFELVIVEDNLPPALSAELQQGGLPVATVTQDGGMAQALLSASDPNPADTVTAAWGWFPGSPTPEEGFGLPTFTFDPALTETGAYQLRGRASDDGTPAEETTRDQVARVIATAPALADVVDSDGDGFADADEGLLDLNGNGVSDWLDPSTYRHHVPARTGGSALLQVAAGYQLSLGQPAAATGEDALVSITDIAEHADSGGPVDNAADPAFSYPGGIFDVTVSGLAGGGEFVALVLPQMAAVPEGATLRLYSYNSGWEDANLVAENEVYSAPGAPGACPAPDSPLYTSGLTAGDHCVQVRLQDNGANDADLTPRLFRFTGGVTSARTPPAIAASAMALADADATAGSRDVPLLAFRLDSNSSDVRLDGLTLAASGSGDDASDIATVRVWHDLNANGQVDGADGEVGTGTFASDDGTLEIRFATPLVLDAGVTDFIVSYDFQESGND